MLENIHTICGFERNPLLAKSLIRGVQFQKRLGKACKVGFLNA